MEASYIISLYILYYCIYFEKPFDRPILLLIIFNLLFYIVGFTVESSFFPSQHQNKSAVAAVAAADVDVEKSGNDNCCFIFAHKFDVDANVNENKMMGSYVVDMKVIKEVFSQHILDVISKSKTSNQLFILDEIGRMQMLSSSFEEALDGLFAETIQSSSSSSSSEVVKGGDYRGKTDASVIASIRSGDKWTTKYTSNPRAVLIELTEENRNDSNLLELFDCLAINLPKIHVLNGGKRLSIFTKMFADYVSRQQWVQALKLFKNALKYFIEHRISICTSSSKTKSDSSSCMSDDANEVEISWNVLGDHGMHKVSILLQDALHSLPSTSDSYSCDCDLFLGKGKYASLACRECSHIQVVRIFRIPAE